MKTALFIAAGLLAALVAAPTTMAAGVEADATTVVEAPTDLIVDCGPLISDYCDLAIALCSLVIQEWVCNAIK